MFNQIGLIFNYSIYKKLPAFSSETLNVSGKKAGSFCVKCSMFLAKNIRISTSYVRPAA